MFFYISKILQPLLWPFNLALIALIACAVCFYFRRIREARLFSAIALGILFISSLPFVAFFLFGSLESRYPSLDVNQVQKADAIVVLGGTIFTKQPPRLVAEEAGGSRLVPAARLYRAGVAPLIIVSSGVQYQLSDGTPRADGMDMRDFLVDQGIPASAILVEDRSRNTDENARFTRELMERERIRPAIILVTSAFHLPRAVAMFEKYGFEQITPFPTEKRVNTVRRWTELLPDLASLELTTSAIKEYVGRWAFYFK